MTLEDGDIISPKQGALTPSIVKSLVTLWFDKFIDAFNMYRVILLEINWKDCVPTCPELPENNFAFVSVDVPVGN